MGLEAAFCAASQTHTSPRPGPTVNSKKKPKEPVSKWPQVGPGFIVAAAFVGPGTVMTATVAGRDFGFQLVWVVLFSVFAAIVLQEMATRLGTLTGLGLGELLRRQFSAKAARIALGLLVVTAIGFGNAAYQTGNLTGATDGLANLFLLTPKVLIVVIAALASTLLWFGSYKVVERVLVTAVAMMGLAFVAAAIIAIIKQPFNWKQWIPNAPSGSLTIIMALIGTTLVPYNLFLHASASSKRWSSLRPRDRGLSAARLDSVLGIIAGGIVTLSILIASAAANSSATEAADASKSDLAQSLSILVGNKYAGIIFYSGVAAAGMTSAITAPMAGGLAVCGILGWSTERKSITFRSVWIIIMLSGTLASLLFGASPQETIIIAQAANMLALPIIAGVLLLACNAKILSRYANSKLQNVIAGAIVLFVSLLSGYKLIALLTEVIRNISF